jgi:hypothetical protein
MNHERFKRRIWLTIICSIFVVGLIFTYVPQAVSAPKMVAGK